MARKRDSRERRAGAAPVTKKVPESKPVRTARQKERLHPLVNKYLPEKIAHLWVNIEGVTYVIMLRKRWFMPQDELIWPIVSCQILLDPVQMLPRIATGSIVPILIGHCEVTRTPIE